MKKLFIVLLILASGGCSKPSLEKVARQAMAAKNGALVLIDTNTGNVVYSDKGQAQKKAPPCSTFKIYNTLIGIETGKVASANELFYKWDGTKHPFASWNKNQTLKEAFQNSCVPAYQNLARKIGAVTMQEWLDKISYGDGNISSGIDDFWLPHKKKQSILISPEEQARLIHKLITNQLPFSAKAQAVLKEIMLVKKTARGKLYGKTGSGVDYSDPATVKFNRGWFVGYVESGKQRYSFACHLEGEGMSGKVAKGVVLGVFEKMGLI